MTNKDAIRVLKAIKEHPSMGVYLPDEYEALVLAIKALEERPQGDLISREALKKACAEVVRGSNNSDFIPCPTWNKAMELIDNAPTVEPEITNDDLQAAMTESYHLGYELAETKFKRPHGKWIPKQSWDNTHIWVCSECENQNKHGITTEKACWKCGADMRKEEDNDNK